LSTLSLSRSSDDIHHGAVAAGDQHVVLTIFLYAIISTGRFPPPSSASIPPSCLLNEYPAKKISTGAQLLSGKNVHLTIDGNGRKVLWENAFHISCEVWKT
jgi:hypothetical protein